MAQGTTYRDGEPCDHPGCASHITHPCEKCGRIAARGGVAFIPVSLDVLEQWAHDLRQTPMACNCPMGTGGQVHNWNCVFNPRHFAVKVVSNVIRP